jgi:hypothetical protein
MLHVTAISHFSSSSPQGFVFTNYKFSVRLTIPNVQGSDNLETTRWSGVHIAVLKKWNKED